MVKSVVLSESSIKKLVKEIEQLQKTLPDKVEAFCKDLAQIGIDTASRILATDYRSRGDGVFLEKKSNGEYLVVAQGNQVAFIEFGVGVVGQSGGYPANKLPASWHYDERRSPWAHDLTDPTIWYYYDDNHEVQKTRGDMPVGFMNTASEEMRQSIASLAKEYFG